MISGLLSYRNHYEESREKKLILTFDDHSLMFLDLI